MWGAIIGDLAGSIYEFEQLKGITKVEVKNLIEENSFFSDDTILTVAVLDAILHDRDYESYLRKYARAYINYKPDFNPYFKGIFSPGFSEWAKGNEEGFSKGNGAMMRISPVGYLFNSREDVIENSSLATIPSHNSLDAINSATTVAMIIYLARIGWSKEEIIKELDLSFSYIPFTKFNMTCNDTISNCLYATFTSNSFDESIRTVISFGGDTDTNACIVGSMAEALYGIDDLLIEKAKTKLPDQFVKKLTLGYQNSNIFHK
jgi:ADP-ribosylglycohydrolase